MGRFDQICKSEKAAGRELRLEEEEQQLKVDREHFQGRGNWDLTQRPEREGVRRVCRNERKRLVCLQPGSGRWVPLLAQGTVRIDHSEEGEGFGELRVGISLVFLGLDLL